MLPQKCVFFTTYVKSALLLLEEKNFYIFIKLKPNYFLKNQRSSSSFFVDVQIQNGQEVLDSLISSILDMRLVCWGSIAILDLYNLVQVSKNDDEEHCFFK